MVVVAVVDKSVVYDDAMPNLLNSHGLAVDQQHVAEQSRHHFDHHQHPHRHLHMSAIVLGR